MRIPNRDKRSARIVGGRSFVPGEEEKKKKKKKKKKEQSPLLRHTERLEFLRTVKRRNGVRFRLEKNSKVRREGSTDVVSSGGGPRFFVKFPPTDRPTDRPTILP